MTPPRFRRHRSRDRRAPVFGGDFGGDDRDITEVLGRPADWAAASLEWGGASSIGLPDGDAPPAVSPADDYRRAIARANAAPETAPLRARPRGPDMFPALPAGPPPAPPRPAPAGPRDTGPQQRLPRFARTAARPRPRRDPDCAIFIWSSLLGQHIMLCGVCPKERRNRYADPIAGTMPFTFEALRVSAHVSGWRLDAFTRWACPACQLTPAYWSPRQVIQWDPDALDAYMAGDPHAESRHRAAAELDLITDVAAGASHGRHRAATR